MTSIQNSNILKRFRKFVNHLGNMVTFNKGIFYKVEHRMSCYAYINYII